MPGLYVDKTISRRQRREKIIRGRKPSRRLTIIADATISGWVKQMAMDVAEASDLLQSVGPVEAQSILNNIRDKWRGLLNGRTETFVRQWATAVSEAQSAVFQESIEKAIGVDRALIIDGPALQYALDASSMDAVQLIKSVPDNFFDDIQRATLNYYQGVPFPEDRTLVEEIQQMTGHTFERARLIARDQTSKIHIAVTRARNEEVGIEEYIWRTVGDERVAGSPSAPETNRVHGNHYKRNGKKFRWDSPPHDGHPGFAINCRCIAEPVVNVESLRYV